MQSGPSTSSSSVIDSDLVREVERLGFERNFIVDSLKSRQQNKATVAYHLLADNRNRMPSSAYLKEEMTEGRDTFAYNSGVMGSHRSSGNLQPAPRIVVERKWRLGLRTRCHPGHLVQELCIALNKMKVSYKKGRMPYSIKCRAEIVHPAQTEFGQNEDTSMMDDDTRLARDDEENKKEIMKFEFQVYRTREGEYTLDVQRLEGGLLLFLTLTSEIMANLRF